MIDVSKLCFSYPRSGIMVLDGIDLECNDGSINILLGLNGCGKTTLIKALAGILRPKSGSISYFGKDFLSLKVEERSKIVSYVPQNSEMTGDYLVSDYLSFSTVNTLEFYQSPGEEQKKKVEACMDRFGITHLADKRLGEISGGERQIVSICAAMVQNTKIILLDEPTSSLDLSNQNKILSLLKEIVAEEDKTIFLSTHNPNHALYLNGQVFMMKGGKIIDEGCASDVIEVERLRVLYGDRICYSKDLLYNEVSFR